MRIRFAPGSIASLTLALLLSFTISSRLEADDPPKPVEITSLPRVPAAIHNALQAKNFPAAVELIDAELAKPNVAAPDYLLYLKGRAQTEQAQYPAAFETFTRLEGQHPQSRWLSRSKFGRADVLVRQRNYQEAGVIYQAEAQRLLSAGRRDELSGIYLEFADRYFEGIPAKDPAGEKKPDYQQALTYYEQALTLKPSFKSQQQIELRVARCRQELGQHAEAIAAYRAFLDRYAAATTRPEQKASDELQVQARFQLGRAQLAAGQPAEARKTWQDFLSHESTKKVGGALVAEATYQLAATYGIPQPATVGDLELGVHALEKFVESFSKHKLAAKAELQIAQSYVHHARFDQAIERLKALIANKAYEGSDHVAEARMLLGQSYFVQKKFDEAIAAWREFLDKHPTDKHWSDVQRQVVDSEFEMAAEQRREKNYDKARELWSTFLNKYPLDARAPRILFEFGAMKFSAAADLHKEELKKAGVDLAKTPNERVMSDGVRALFEAAIADWGRLVTKYPGTNESSQAAYTVALTLEDHLGRLTDALEAYKKVEGPLAEKARLRIINLTAKQLEIVTERKFRTNEKPEIRITTRNLPNVSVKLYRIDMADYFRKMHLATGVESLDIALIDPDKTWEYQVADYADYRRLTNSVVIPVEGPGVTAVTVSSDKLEATTMLVVSDIDVIVKSSRNEVFVFAENMVARKPAEGVSLLVSDGKNVFAEEKTNKDGILQKSYDQLKSVNDLRIFAVHEGHAASSVTNLQGLDFAVGLSAKGYIFSDRPAYRAGQLVNLKGIVRWVADDRYTFKEGEKYRLDVYDARGRVIHTAEVALNAFGTFADHFLLSETAPQGSYRVHVHQPGKEQSYESQFQVHDFKLEPIHIVVDLPQEVYYRGEKIEGSIALKYYYGTPLAGRPIQYRLGDGPIESATTDAEGKVKVSFETQRYSESQALTLAVQYPERNIGTAKVVYLATRGFDVAVSTLRDVYIAGETFDATAAVSDPAGKPLAADLKLEVFDRTEVNGKPGEKLIASHQVKVLKEAGKAQQTLKIDKAGRYIVRATGTDRFGNPVSGQRDVVISGDDDTVRLRVLAEKHNYNVGDEAKLQLHWREQPALALVTFEGAKVLGYRLVELKEGSNDLALPLDASLAPNFVLSVAVMERNKFHQADSEFRVARKLNVALAPKATTVKPGEEFTVDVTVTDSQGKPVSAELSLAMIRKNLLERFGDNRAAIDEFFGAGYRKPSVRAGSSSTFAYRPATRAISGAVIAEAERRELEAVERADDESRQWHTLQSVEQSLSITLGVEGKPQGDSKDGESTSSDRSNSEGDNGDVNQNGGEPAMAKPDEPVSGPGPGNLPQEQYRKTKNSKALNQMRTKFDLGRRGSVDKLEKELSNSEGRLSGHSYFLRDDVQLFGSNVKGNVAAGDLGGVVIMGNGAVDFSDFATFNFTNRGVVGLNGRGEVQHFADFDGDGFNVPAGESLHILPLDVTAETAYWNPVIVTDAAGKATLKFIMPAESTAWTLSAKGVNSDTLSGKAETDIITKRDLFGEIKSPLAFTEGDKASILVEVHNAALAKGEKIDVILKATIGERTTELRKQVTVDGPGVNEVTFPLEVTAGSKVEFELNVAHGETKAATRQTVLVQPYGMPVFATASGASAQNTTAFVGHDKKLAVQNPTLEIIIGPSVNRTLVDAVLGARVSICEVSMQTSSFERAISDVLGGVGLLKTIGAARENGSPEATELAARIQSGVSQLVSSQREDGGWSWSGKPEIDKSDRYLSSRAVWALAASRTAGFAVPNETFDKATAYLQTAFTSSIQTDREAQAIVLHGLAEAGRADFAFANRLYRERNNLANSGLLHLALSLIALDRKEMALDVLKLVKIGADPKTANRPDDSAARKDIPWMQSGVELRALYLLALEKADPSSTQAGNLADWLMAARLGSRWMPEKANGPAIAALADWFARTQHVAEKYTLSVFVNEKLVEKIAVDPSKDGSRRLEVPQRMLVDGQQRINFDIEGRGRFSYSAVLGGFVPADKLANTVQSWHVSRFYEPAQRMLDGEVIPRGFDVLAGSYNHFRNSLTQLPMGERGEVTLNVYRTDIRGTRDEQLDYLVITEPIPAGASVLADSINGAFERYEITPGAITFYVGDRAGIGDIHYTLVGYLPGQYRTAPTLVRSFYRPERIAVNEVKQLKVLPRDGKSKDEYKLTPVELFEFGKRLAAKRQFKEAAAHLTTLFKDYRLRPEVYQQVVQLLFAAALDAGTNHLIVEYFEIIKEKFPSVEIDFDSILQVGSAYKDLGEYERSYLVFRATLEAGFERESQIAGFLDERGEFLRSVSVMERLLGDYPAESYVATSTYALAQEVYGKASELAGDEKLRTAKVTRAGLISTSIEMLDHFLSTWPNDPASDQAAFSMATAYLDLEKYDVAIARCRLFAERYPQSQLLDSYWYLIGFSQFALGQHEKALEMCHKVAESTRKDPATGVELAAANKWQAIYIMGQVYHSLGKPREAIDEYTRVKDKFPDANEAIDFFTRKDIRLPEVTTVKPGDEAKVPLTFRNVASTNVKVYRIDLLKFSLMQRNLDRITAINLAGIRPYHELTQPLGDGHDFRDREQPLTLPLKEEGAYLVVCRGEDLYTSGLVLVSPLALEIQEDAPSGRVRVTVKNTVEDHYAHKVHVKVIGSQNPDFVSGETDLRGIFIADKIVGMSTVIAKINENRYAFFRGKTMLAAPEPAPAPPSDQSAGSTPQGGKPNSQRSQNEILLENIIQQNGSINTLQRQQYRGLLENQKKGVKAESAY